MIVTEQAGAGPSSAPDGGPIAPNDENDDVFAKPSVYNRLALWSRNKAGKIVDGWHSFQKFMWNRDKREVMGRNGKSWAQIGLFYFVFYTFLAGFWAAMFAIFYQTVSLERPTYNSLITPPGLNLVPFPDKQLRIEYGVASEDEDRLRIEQEITENVFEALGIDQSTHEDCPNTTNTPIASPPQQRFCRYDPSLLGPCAPDNSGYDSRQPCLYIGLNRVWGWVPDGYNPDQLEALFGGTVYESANYSSRIFFTCNVREEDKEHVDFINIYPQEGVSFGHYPYVVGTDPAQQKRYIRPVVAVKVGLKNPDVDVRIECRARAKNIPEEAQGGIFGSREEPSRFRVRIMVRS